MKDDDDDEEKEEDQNADDHHDDLGYKVYDVLRGKSPPHNVETM